MTKSSAQYRFLAAHLIFMRNALDQMRNALSRYIAYFGNQSLNSPNVQAAIALAGPRAEGIKVYDQFKSYFAYFMGSKVENMLNSNGTVKLGVPSLTTPDGD